MSLKKSRAAVVDKAAELVAQWKQARAAVDKATELVAQWEHEQASRSAELTAVERSAGAQALDGGPGAGAQITRRVGELRTAVETATQAVSAARARHEQARRDLLRVAAEELARRAAERHEQSDRHDDHTAELLDKLERHDGARYVPWSPEARTTERITYTPPTGPKLRAAARQLDERAAAIRALADAATVTDGQLDEALAEADPDGPEAARIAEHKTRKAREAEAVHQLEREEAARRREALRQREAV